MKEKSHRASQRCYRSGVETLLRTHARRLDGYSLYTANHLRVPRARQPIVARFDQPHASSDGGAVLLKALDTQLGLTRAAGRRLTDARQPGKVAARADRVGAAARLRARLRLRRLQRRRAAGRRSRSTSCCSTAIRSPGRPWPRSRRCRASRTPWAGRRCTWRAWPWPTRSSSTIGGGSRAGPAGSRSTSIPPTTPPTGSRSSPSSTATTTPGATCRWWRR